MYTIVWSSTDGGADCNKKLYIKIKKPPLQVNFRAQSNLILPGQSSKLVWRSVGSDTCVGQGFNTGGKVYGTTKVTPTKTTRYSVECFADGLKKKNLQPYTLESRKK